jgi:hypothetical protein
LRSPLSTLPARIIVPAFPQRSPPRLLTAAACGGLGSAPDCRTRRAFLHLRYSCVKPCGPAFTRDTRPKAEVRWIEPSRFRASPRRRLAENRIFSEANVAGLWSCNSARFIALAAWSTKARVLEQPFAYAGIVRFSKSTLAEPLWRRLHWSGDEQRPRGY